MPNEKVFTQIDFGGSLILRDQYAIGLKEHFNLKSQNVIQNGRTIKGLLGFEKYIKYPLAISGAVNNKIRSIFRYANLTNDTFITLVHVKNDIYTVDESNEIITTTPITPGGDTYNTNDIQWAYSNNILYFVDGALHGTSGLSKYNGTSISTVTITNSLAPSLICTYFNRLILAGDPAYPNRLLWSDAGDIETIDTTNNYVEIPAPRGAKIRAITQYQDSLIIFNDNSIHTMYGNQLPNTVTVLSSNIGTPATDSVVTHGYDLIWFGSDKHVYLIRGGSFYDLTTEYLDSLPVDNDYLSDVVCWIEDDRLHVSFKHEDNALPFNNTLFICDYTNPKDPKWCGPHEGWRINCIAQYNYRSDTQQVVYGDSYSSMLWNRANNYYQGVGINTLVDDASATTTEIDVEVSDNDIALFDLASANALSGCLIKIGDEYEVINTSTAASSNKLTITLRAALSSAPADDSVIYIGRMEMVYETVQNVFKIPYELKYFKKMYVQAKSISSASLIAILLHNGSNSGNEYTIDLSDDQALWDTAVWDTDVWSVDNQVLNREIDYDIYDEYGWQSRIQFKNQVDVNKTLEIVGLNLIYESEEKVRND